MSEQTKVMEARAQARYIRISPRKARLVVDQIRGKKIDDARAILQFSELGASEVVLKVLNSAVANAENNHGMRSANLCVARTYVDEGPTLKRIRPRAKGQASRINKRTCHITVVVAPRKEA
ncbi:MAG: 50S ribosomal protein L22 [Coriobacteriales bacterium]|nr:50S ribosomal protein L22 [Coriobacteriales bacterium]